VYDFDASFPPLSAESWQLTSTENHKNTTPDQPDYSFMVYDRIQR